jgi:activator of HSP90 ATPase
MKIKTKNLKQTARIPAGPEAVYEALMTSKGHRAFTGEAAKISTKVGGSFSAYAGWCEGKNLELKPGRKIVQSWRGGDWPEGHYSTATFTLKAVKGGTELAFTQVGIPAGLFEDIKGGWIEHYWDRLAAYFA